MTDLAKREFDRQRKVVDTLLTAHTILRERYERRARCLTLLIMAFSVAATAVAFISSKQAINLGPFSARVQVWVGLLTCAIFLLSIIDLQVEWRRKAWAHSEATRRIADLKTKYRRGHEDGGIVQSEFDLTSEYERTMDALAALRVPIKDAQFTRLKARHWRKVEVSKRVSARPQRPWLLHRLDVLREGLKEPAVPANAPAARERAEDGNAP